MRLRAFYDVNKLTETLTTSSCVANATNAQCPCTLLINFFNDVSQQFHPLCQDVLGNSHHLRFLTERIFPQILFKRFWELARHRHWKEKRKLHATTFHNFPHLASANRRSIMFNKFNYLELVGDEVAGCLARKSSAFAVFIIANEFFSFI